jgi:hypothetical protein
MLVRVKKDICNFEQNNFFELNIIAPENYGNYKYYFVDSYNSKDIKYPPPYLWEQVYIKKNDIFLKLKEIKFRSHGILLAEFAEVLFNGRIFWAENWQFQGL